MDELTVWQRHQLKRMQERLEQWWRATIKKDPSAEDGEWSKFEIEAGRTSYNDEGEPLFDIRLTESNTGEAL